MKNFVIGALTALVATQAAGCVITTSDPDYATVVATWAIKTVSGAVATCPPGFTTAALFNVATDAGGVPLAPCTGPGSISDTCFVDLFNCEDNAGASAPLPPAQYQTWVAITDTNGTNAYATSLSAYLDVRDDNLPFNTTIYDNGGYFAVDWDLKAASNNAALSCAQAGASFVQADVTVSGSTSFVETNPWPCDDHYGVTSVIPEGSYTVTVQALDSAEGYLGKAPEYINKVIQGPNKVTDLGSALITIDDL
jgi:hypothetical protein